MGIRIGKLALYTGCGGLDNDGWTEGWAFIGFASPFSSTTRVRFKVQTKQLLDVLGGASARWRLPNVSATQTLVENSSGIIIPACLKVSTANIAPRQGTVIPSGARLRGSYRR
jgi:hypothetical protein